MGQTKATMTSARQGLGSFFQALLDFVENRGLTAQVRAQVSPGTQALIDKPPRAMGFIDSQPIDEVEAALATLVSPEVLTECGLACARPLGWSLLQPVLRLAFQFFGQSPEPIFGNLDMFFSLVIRGISFSFERKGKGGTVLARFAGEETPMAAFQVLRGTLLFVFEATSTKGTIDEPVMVETTAAGTTVRYQVHWE